MSTIDEQIDKMLKRLIGDVDDDMEFSGAIFKSNTDAAKRVQASIAEAHHQISKLLVEARKDELAQAAQQVLSPKSFYFRDRLAALTAEQRGKE